MLKWNSRNPPYRVRIPEYLQVPAEYGRVGLVVGEHRGVDGLGPLVAVLLDGAASDTVAAIKADCIVLEGSRENQVPRGRSSIVEGSDAVRAKVAPLPEWCLQWQDLVRP
jgi:hypothetical protein